MLTSYPSSYIGRLFAVRLRPELKELYMFTLLFSFASALITIFEPVFFYQENFTLSQIALYYALHYTLYLFILPLGGKFAARFGLERSLAVSTPLFVLYFIGLALIPQIRGLFWVMWVVLTLHKIFYWPAFHADFAKFGDGRNRGTELSWMTLLKWGVGILGPAAGGVIATAFGFPTLFIVAAVTIMLAGLPLLRTRERYRVSNFSYWLPWRLMISRQHRGVMTAMLGMGENLIDLVFWPIFAFIVLGSAALLGLLSTVTMAVMTLAGFFIGEMSDRFSRRQVLRLHLPFLSLSYLLRPLAASPVKVLLTDTLARSSYIGVNIPMLSRLYTKGKKAGVLRYMVAWEMALVVGKILTAWLLVWVFATFVPFTAFTFTFILAAALVWLYLFL